MSSKVWFITGAASGFGLALTQHAVARGDRVVATARAPSTELAELQPAHKDTLLVLTLDVTSAPDISVAFQEAKAAFGRVDVVFNNAAVAVFGEVEGTPDDVARRVFEVNFWGGANVAREAVRFFREENPAGVGGRLLSVSSYVGLVPFGGCGYYSAAKAALEAVNQALAGEVDPTWNIKITVIVLGTVRSGMAHKAVTLPPAKGYEDPSTPAAKGRAVVKAAQDAGVRCGDLGKTIDKIYELTELEHPPFRFIVGKDSLSVVRAHLENLDRDMDEYESWSEDLLEDM